MKAEQALEMMKARLGSLAEGFSGTGIVAKVECDLLDKKMNEVESLSRAKIVTVSLVLSAEGVKDGEEYCLSLGAEVSHGSVNETLTRDMRDFEELVGQTLIRLAKYENKSEGIHALVKESEGELDGIASDIRARSRKRIITAAVAALAIGAIIALAVVITLGAGA